MIALLTACLFFCNPCARADLHQQKSARKLCSATLNFGVVYLREARWPQWAGLRIERSGFEF